MERSRDSFTKALVGLLCILALVAVQAAFLLLQKNDAERVMEGATYIFRSEDIASNPQRIAAEVLDMAERDLLSCPRVVNASGVAYLDRRDLKPCPSSPWLLQGAYVTRTIESVTGQSWTISVVVHNSMTFLIALWVSRLLALVTVLGGFALARSISARIFLHREHAKRVEDISRQVAHDIRSPLSAIRILLQRASLKPEHAEIAHASFERMDRIANDVLAWRNKEVAPARCAPDSVVERIVREKQAEFLNSPRLNWSLNIERCLSVIADERELGRIVSNLINNAVEALPDRAGTLSISTRSARNGVMIEIQDTGCGLSKAQLKKVGERGWTTKSAGHGLGLHHAIESVESWGGRLKLTSNEGVGTKVTIELRTS